MSTLYDSLAATALRQIQEKGRPITLRLPGIVFDPQTGATVESNTDVKTSAFFTAFKAGQIDGSAIQRGDQRLLIAAEGLGAVPTTAHQVIDGEEVWQVQDVETVQPGDTVILYKLLVRR